MGNKVMDLMVNKFMNWDYYSSPVTEGRILIIWRKIFVKVILLEETNQYAHCFVKMAGQRHAFSATFVYGLNTMEERKRIWNSLPKLTLPATSWVILGDFNAIFTTKDIDGGKPVSKSELLDSSQWLVGNQVDSLKTIFRWETVSDHCSCTVSTMAMENLGVKLFRFYNFWTDHKDFKEVALNSWRKSINGTDLTAIYLKTMRLKHKLKKFNRDHIGDIGVQYQVAKDQYQEALFQAHKHPRDLPFQEKAKAPAKAFTTQEQITWVVNNFSGVVSHFLDHFRSFMGSPSSATKKINMQCVELGTKLLIDQQLNLSKPFSHKEIRDAVFSIPIIKSPSPDGFGYDFFKVLWLDIGGEICKAVGHFFETGIFPDELHNTTLSLVPKSDNPSRAVDYRPIACCSTI
ncbi:uncharacterized protein LOC133824176 [Humulus lupulus]|uniref:uncharacterized protein LOC133824176 n=1 Tax=Humulus lupulus TaxID=3486 RepID=UPI002B409621|nr:uncharacterized protein LOC133824176 [Humulus lupulus]